MAHISPLRHLITEGMSARSDTTDASYAAMTNLTAVVIRLRRISTGPRMAAGQNRDL